MPNKGHRSAPHRSSRSDRRHVDRPRSTASDNISVPSTIPSTSAGRTSSTSITSPSDDTPMDLDPYPSSIQSQVDFGVAAFASHPQTGFDPLQAYPGQGSHLPTDPNPPYYMYMTASPEPIDYGNHGDGDDLAASMVVSPGSPPPPRSQRPTLIEEEMMKQESKKSGRTTKSHTGEPSAVFPWRQDPSNVFPPQGFAAGGYQPYDPNLVDALGDQARSPYPLAIAEADMYDHPNGQIGNEQENATVNHWGQENVAVNHWEQENVVVNHWEQGNVVVNHWHQDDGYLNQNEEDGWVFVADQ